MPMYDAGNLSPPFLGLSDCSVDAGNRRLLDIPELELSSDGITAIMGPNGAGKSVLLRVLHGLVTPGAGVVKAEGTPQSPERLRQQSLVLQTPVLLRRTAEANVRFALRTRRLPNDRTGELLARVHLSDKARTPARRLSGGEQQRLAIAQALAIEPSVLLLDEPTASLDPAATLMIEDILRDTAASGVRIVLVSHDASQARRLASEVIFLSKGRVVEQAEAKTFFDTPKSAAAQDYLAGRLTT